MANTTAEREPAGGAWPLRHVALAVAFHRQVALGEPKKVAIHLLGVAAAELEGRLFADVDAVELRLLVAVDAREEADLSRLGRRCGGQHAGNSCHEKSASHASPHSKL